MAGAKKKGMSSLEKDISKKRILPPGSKIAAAIWARKGPLSEKFVRKVEKQYQRGKNQNS